MGFELFFVLQPLVDPKVTLHELQGACEGSLEGEGASFPMTSFLGCSDGNQIQSATCPRDLNLFSPALLSIER